MSLKKFLKESAATVIENTSTAASVVAATAADAGEKTARTLCAGANTVAGVGGKALTTAVDTAQKLHHDRLLAFYNPVFPEQYQSPDYDLPYLIIIEDEDQRKDIEICNGAIGWLQTENGMEILHLYDEAVEFSGINFYPYAICEGAYYIDTFSRNRFINLDVYHEIIQKEKIEELGNIAYSLGAKECYLESYEEDISTARLQASSEAKLNIAAATEKASLNMEQQVESFKKCSIVFSQVFEGSDNPHEPNLHWFKNDIGITSLIEKRCSDKNCLQEYSIQIDTTSSMAISLSRAAKIDAALKIAKASSHTSIESRAKNESRKKLVYTIKF